MKNNNKKILVSILAGAMLLASATAVSAASTWGSRSSSAMGNMGGMQMGDMMESYVEKTNALSYSDLTGGIVSSEDLFSKRDLKQTADLSEAQTITVTNNATIEITEEGVYVLTGTASNCTVKIAADKEAKIQLVLDGVTIANDDFPAIYVVSADKVFVTTAEGTENTLTVTGSFKSDGSTNTDAVIYSKEDLVLNGKGTLTVVSAKGNGIASKDDLKVTGGTLNITSALDALEANDSIVIYDGNITISSQKDGLHAENEDDDSLGYIWIGGGTLNVTAKSDGIQGTSFVQIDGGTITLSASEGIEGTYVQINGGTLNVTGSDDGINASNKSSAYETAIEIAGGSLTVAVGQADTDARDANGNIYVSGGTINVTSTVSSFDYDGTATYTGGTIIINGVTQSGIPAAAMMGGMGGMNMGGFGGRH
ncbi:MAG: carbohydrate-binding domain-containing protein [Clostridiales bacterium]|nr:carbohydrate-binding domain-containing protein [Clostridiales bacterium]